MKWKEVIQIKAFNNEMKQRAFQEAVNLDLPAQGEIPERIEVLDGNNLDTEVCIMLIWNNGPDVPVKSWIGIALTRVFSEFGWVSHSVWANQKTVTRQPLNRKGVQNHAYSV